MTLIGKVDLTKKNSTTPYFGELRQFERRGRTIFQIEDAALGVLGSMMVKNSTSRYEIEALDNLTLKLPFKEKVHGIGTAFMELEIAHCSDWRKNLKRAPLVLLARREAFGFYQKMGLVFDRSFYPSPGISKMYLPEQVQAKWKTKIFRSPKIIGHDPEFLNQLLLEALAKAPQKIRSIVLSYCFSKSDYLGLLDKLGRKPAGASAGSTFRRLPLLLQ